MALLDVARVRRLAAGTQPRSARAVLAFIAAVHLAALAILYDTEWNYLHGALAFVSFGLLNFLWLAIFGRPALSAVLSLAMIVAIVAASMFKFEILWTGLSFFDILIIDHDTISYLLAIVPKARVTALIGILIALPLLIALWRLDPFRIRRGIAASATTGCVVALGTVSALAPQEIWESFQGVNHTSNFFRSAATEVSELLTHGLFAADAQALPRLPAPTQACRPAQKPPHIILLLDESSFDITAAPGIKVPPGYKQHFRSFDGAERKLVVEGTGGPTWYAEYNVLTGLSVRSFGRFAFYVMRIAAGRVERGLPAALARCGYRTLAAFPTSGAFLSTRSFQQTTGIARFIDQDEMGAPDDQQPDSFYLDYALRTIAQERQAGAPLFMFAYVTANHFPWSTTYRPELTPEWKGLGNEPSVDEYVRRQGMSAHDYQDFVARLSQNFPDDRFLIVRFGDHQPALSARILDPKLEDAEIARHVAAYDLQYFTTYYAIDTLNFEPADLSSALPRLDAAYLPIVVQEAAGLPLDPSFTEQKKILGRCRGLFYACGDGREARRFNRLLIDAGLIKNL